MPALVVQDGPRAGLRVQVKDEVVIGRGAEPLSLPDPEVSRRHASVRATKDGLVVEDLGSMNGTWVDGRRLTGPLLLAAGSTLRVGDTTIAVELAASPVTPDVQTAAPARAGPGPPQEQFLPAPNPVRRRVATRSETAVILTFVAIGVTAILLILYFALRGGSGG